MEDTSSRLAKKFLKKASVEKPPTSLRPLIIQYAQMILDVGLTLFPDAQVPPSLAFAVPENTYIAIALDIDAPFPSFGVLGPILHWIQPGLVPSPSSTQLTTTSPFVVDYIGPAPPPGSASHRYIFLLYEQPKDFDSEKYAPPGGQKFGLWKRVRYDLGTFEKETGLGKVLAANYFLSK